MTFRAICHLGAVGAFMLAAYIDRPWSPPGRAERNAGNFCCSLGFVFLALSGAW